jgi:hypothetical protein
LWTGLPIISTRGDSLSDLVESKGLGLTVSEDSAEELADAIIKISDDKEYYDRCVKNVNEISADYSWDKICKPLISFCSDPVSSALKERDADGTDNLGGDSGERPGLIKKFFYHLFSSGPSKTAKYVSNYIKRK